MRNEEGNNLRLLARVAIARGELERAGQLVDESIAILEQVQDQYEWARSLLAQAELAYQRGDLAGCGHALDRCGPVFERLGATLELDRMQKVGDRCRSLDRAGSMSKD
jgi:hypothetical protein